MFIATLKNPAEIQSLNIKWIPENPNWEHFIEAWNYVDTPPLWRALLNSTIVTVSSVALQLLGSSLVGYVLAKHKFRGNNMIFMWILAQLMIPGATSLVPMYVLMNWLKWYNTYWSLIIPGVFSAYTIFLMRQYIITIPNDILDAARLSGCSEFGLFWRMILPLSKPALVALGLINFVGSWNDLLWPMLMIKNSDWFTVQMALSGLWSRTQYPYLHLAAGAITFAAMPVIILTIIFQKYLIKGWTGLSYAKR